MNLDLKGNCSVEVLQNPFQFDRPIKYDLEKKTPGLASLTGKGEPTIFDRAYRGLSQVH